MKNVARLGHMITLLLLICPGALGQSTQETIEAMLRQHVASPEPFSGSVLVAKGGEVVYRGAFGVDAFGSEQANTVDSRYFIGSITKQFTAVAILQLVEEGQLSLDAKLSRWLPQISGSDGISIRHLLTHQSGLARDSLQDYDADVTPLERALSIRETEPLFAPGEREEYSNVGFYALAHILEQVSGMGYAEYVAKKIFAPAGMSDSGFRESIEDRVAGLSMGMGMAVDEHGVNDLGAAPAFHSASLGGGGSIYSTVDDLFRFFTALEGGELLPLETVERMKVQWPVTGEENPRPYRSFGWEVWDHGDQRVLQFTGRINGYVSLICYYEAHQVLVIELCNSKFSDRSRVAGSILQILFGVDHSALLPRNPASAPITSSVQKHLGVYDFPEEQTTVTLALIDGRMTLRSHDEAPIYLEPSSETVFFSRVIPLTITFEPTSAERTERLIWNHGGEMVVTLERLAETSPR